MEIKNTQTEYLIKEQKVGKKLTKRIINLRQK